jgi:hypothetical protein
VTTKDGRWVNFVLTAGAKNLEDSTTGRTVIVFVIDWGTAFRAKFLAAIFTAIFIRSDWFLTIWTM